MELTEKEKQILPELTTFLNSTSNSSKIVDFMLNLKNEQGYDTKGVNWLKIAVALNSKPLIDATFSNYSVSEQSALDAVAYGNAHNAQTNIKVIDKIATQLVHKEYSVKHAQQSPDSNVRNRDKEYETLSTLGYLKEKMTDFFKRKIDIKDKISQFRDKFENKQENSNGLKFGK